MTRCEAVLDNVRDGALALYRLTPRLLAKRSGGDFKCPSHPWPRSSTQPLVKMENAPFADEACILMRADVSE